MRKGRNYDISMGGWSAPIQFEAGRLVEQVHSDLLKGSLNVYGLKDATGDALADKLASEGDPAKRIALAKELQAFFADQQFIITTLYADGLRASSFFCTTAIAAGSRPGSRLRLNVRPYSRICSAVMGSFPPVV